MERFSATADSVRLLKTARMSCCSRGDSFKDPAISTQASSLNSPAPRWGRDNCPGKARFRVGGARLAMLQFQAESSVGSPLGGTASASPGHAKRSQAGSPTPRPALFSKCCRDRLTQLSRSVRSCGRSLSIRVCSRNPRKALLDTATAATDSRPASRIGKAPRMSIWKSALR